MKKAGMITIGVAIIALSGWFLFNKLGMKSLKLSDKEMTQLIEAVSTHKKLSTVDDIQEALTDLNIAFDKAGKKIAPVGITPEQAKMEAQKIIPKMINKLNLRIMEEQKMHRAKDGQYKIWSFLVGIDGDRDVAYLVKVIVDLAMLELQKMEKISNYQMLHRPRGQDNFSDVPIDVMFQLK